MVEVLSEWLLTAERAAVHLPTGVAVIADVHLGYGEARRRAGEAVPLRPVADCLRPLERLGVRHLVVAGDLFEDGCDVSLVDDLLAWADAARAELRVVPGNHDRKLDKQTGRLAVWPDGVTLGTWQVVHGDGAAPTGPFIQGHLHPCLRWGNVSAPCFLVGPQRLVLPAFSQDARGVNVVGAREWADYRCVAVAGGKVLDFGPVGKLTRRRRGERGASAP